ncbi:hypothetical protein KAH81_09035 [bacterium]|nr:hypothetical protein [bacterium]
MCKLRSLFLFISLLLLISPVQIYSAIGITLTGGDWSKSLSETDIVGGPGGDFPNIHESVLDIVTIDVSGTIGDTDEWAVEAKIAGSGYPEELHLYIMRTSDGGGSGSISGGGAYIELTAEFGEIFTGSGDRNDINIREKISGVSATINVAPHDIPLQYRIVDTQESKSRHPEESGNIFDSRTIFDRDVNRRKDCIIMEKSIDKIPVDVESSQKPGAIKSLSKTKKERERKF